MIDGLKNKRFAIHAVLLFAVGMTINCADSPDQNVIHEKHIYTFNFQGEAKTKFIFDTVHGESFAYPMCDIDPIGFSTDSLRKYGRKFPYHFSCDTVGDSLHIQFEVNVECGAELVGSAGMRDSILLIGFKDLRAIRPTSCDCGFRMLYYVPNLGFKRISPYYGEVGQKLDPWE